MPHLPRPLKCHMSPMDTATAGHCTPDTALGTRHQKEPSWHCLSLPEMHGIRMGHGVDWTEQPKAPRKAGRPSAGTEAGGEFYTGPGTTATLGGSDTEFKKPNGCKGEKEKPDPPPAAPAPAQPHLLLLLVPCPLGCLGTVQGLGLCAVDVVQQLVHIAVVHSRLP